MSGGVDSSLSAALLCEQGFDVTGEFLKVWADEATEDALFHCPWEQDLADAQAVADQLGIELIVRNVQREYWERVVQVFVDGYRHGLTPNPDILCNSEIKFGILYDWAIEQGYDAVATGHYARVMDGQLHRGVDATKDQTYFLWRVPAERFQHIVFPIGALPKAQVRDEAAKRGLITATKKDSQGICFLGKVDVRSWLQQELKTQPGEVVDTAGNVIGKHEGVQLYTLGQRHGFRLTAHRSPLTPQYYVVARELDANRLVVAHERPQGRELRATALNWLVPHASALRIGDRIQARIRHGQQPQDARVTAISDQAIAIEFDEPQTAIAPGQSVVFSKGTAIVGGGIIA